MHLLYRHGARYPTTGAGPSTFSAKVQNATMAPGGFKTTGEVCYFVHDNFLGIFAEFD